MHVAETRRQAYKEVEFGIETWFRYFQKTAAFPQMAVEGGDVKEMIDFISEAGIGAIGTVEDARPGRAAVEPVQRRLRRHAPARPRVGQPSGDEAVLRAHRPARHAALPGRRDPPRQATLQAKEFAMGKREDYAAQQMEAVATMTERYQQEISGTSTS